MSFLENERTEETLLIIGDTYRRLDKRVLFGVVGAFVLALPVYFASSYFFTYLLSSAIVPLEVVESVNNQTPLEVIDTKIFSYGNGTYSGFIRIKNTNLDWGVPGQSYSANFKSVGNTSVMAMRGTTYIQSASEKIIVLTRFSSPDVPTQLEFSLDQTNFVRRPNPINLNLDVQRRDNNFNTATPSVNAVIVNRSPFIIDKVDLTVILFDNSNNIVGANYTNINELKSFETRSFQFGWFGTIKNVARYEIIPEVNLYDRNALRLPSGQTPYDENQ